MLPTELPRLVFGFQKCGGGGGGEGAIDGTHTCSHILLKNDQNNKDDFILVKDNLKFIFNQI